MKKTLVIISVLASLNIMAQGFQDFVNSLFASPAGQRQVRVDSFMTANTQFPLIEDDSVANFILTGNFSLVQVAGDMNGWTPTTPGYTMVKVPSTNFFFLTKYYETKARLDYKFVTNGSSWILDPNNPNQVSGGFGPNSELAMPQYVQPWEIIDYSGVNKGVLEQKTITSSIMNGTYQVYVYLPYDYDTTASYPVAYFHDGGEYIQLGSARHVLDNLIDSNLIEPLIAVFVSPNDRNEEYAFSKRTQFASFFTTELVSWVDSRYATIPDSAHRATIGASFGGHISAYIAYNNPGVFYKTGQHSGAWWPNNYEVADLVSLSPHIDLAMPSVWGSYEGGLTDMWRIFEDSMNFYNYPNKYFQEYPEGHSWGLWRATTDELLIQLFPGPAVISVPEYKQEVAMEVYPNPADYEVYLEGDLEGSGSIVNSAGKVFKHFQLTEKGRVDLTGIPPGLYWIRLAGESVPLVIRP